MPKITEITQITAITNDTTLVVVNDGFVRRYSYQNLYDKLTTNGGFGTQGVQGIQGSMGGGIQGTQGATGAGTQGTAGTTASQGIQGIQGTSGSSSAYSRTTAAGVTSSIANNATGNISITGFKSYSLLKIQTSAAAWVRLYTTSAARSSDSARAQTTDPTPGSGVIAEIITSGSQMQTMTPAVVGFNDDGTPGTTIYAAVTNLSGGSTAITVTLTLLQLEA